MTVKVNTFVDFFYLASGDLARTKMKMNCLNLPFLCNEVTNHVSQKEANKK